MPSHPATPVQPTPDHAAVRGGADVRPSVCHCQVLRQAARRATALYDQAMAPFGLRISQYAVLTRLHRAGALSVHSLAAELVLDRTTLGRNLRPLERDGLIASEVDPADRRVRRLVLTSRGAEVLAAAGPAWAAAQARYESGYGMQAAVALRGELHRLTNALGPIDG